MRVRKAVNRIGVRSIVKKPASTLTLSDLQRELVRASDPQSARDLAVFFKTGKGEYGEGDEFCGITVPELRKIAKRYLHLPLADVKKLLSSRVHEHRFTALEILVFQYEAGDESAKKKVFEFYLRHARYINNWDLVDTSAPYIVGEYLATRRERFSISWPNLRTSGSVESRLLPHCHSSEAAISKIHLASPPYC
jgi:hypothetical protein